MTINTQNDNQNLNREGHKSSISETPKEVKQDDLLDTKYFTDGVVDFIKNAESPLLISLDGEWGIGKTSIMNTIKHELCDNDYAKFYGVWVNTWQFSLLDSSPAPQAVVRILQSIVNQIMVLNPNYDRREQISQLMGAIASVSSGLRTASDVTGDPLFGVGKTTLGFIEKMSNKIKSFFGATSRSSSTDNAALVKQLSEEIKQLVDEVLNKTNTINIRDVCVQKYETYNPFDFSKLNLGICGKAIVFLFLVLCNFFTMCGFIMYYLVLMVADGFGTICSYSLLLIRTVFEFICYIPKIAYTILCDKDWPKTSKRDGFVFFIDDLDRIDPSLALEIIEILASVFSFKKCIFILAVDKRSLMEVVRSKLDKRKINVKINENSESVVDVYCKQYLDRYIHVSIDVFKEAYNIRPLLRESLVNISFFTSKELDNELLALLDKVVSYSIGKNPRSVKQLINSLSLLKTFRVYAWKYDERDKNVSRQVNVLIKKIVFIIQCIKINYPDLCLALATRPYFKTWDMRFAAKFSNENSLQQSKQLAIKCHAASEWEYALFHLCKFDCHSHLKFHSIRQVFSAIDESFNKFISENHIEQSRQLTFYKNIINHIFCCFYGFIGNESEYRINIIYVVQDNEV